MKLIKYIFKLTLLTTTTMHAESMMQMQNHGMIQMQNQCMQKRKIQQMTEKEKLIMECRILATEITKQRRKIQQMTERKFIN